MPGPHEPDARKRTIYRPVPLAPSRLTNSPQKRSVPGGIEQQERQLSPPHYDQWVGGSDRDGSAGPTVGEITEEIDALDAEEERQSVITDELCAIYGFELTDVQDFLPRNSLPRGKEHSPAPSKLTLPPCRQAVVTASPAPTHAQQARPNGRGSEKQDRSSMRDTARRARALSHTPSQRTGDVIDMDRRNSLGGMRYA
jgi:hypothetical protein